MHWRVAIIDADFIIAVHFGRRRQCRYDGDKLLFDIVAPKQRRRGYGRCRGGLSSLPRDALYAAARSLMLGIDIALTREEKIARAQFGVAASARA